MLLAINDRIKGWLGAFIVVLIGLPFALWGIQSYIGGADEQYAVRIDDREITIRELDNDVTRLRQQAAREQDGRVPDETVLRRTAIDRIVNTSVLEQVADEQGLAISDQVLGARIRQLFSRDGEFDPEQYRMIVQSQGMTPQMFEQSYRNELRVDQLKAALMNTAIVTEDNARRILQLQQQERDITWLTLNVDKLVSDIEVSEEDIREYYETRASQFMTPARVSVEYVELSADTIEGIEVDEVRVKSLYDDYVTQQQQREERKARHILITTNEDAGKARQTIEDIANQLADGADFAALAKQYSQDPGSAEDGGDLEWVGIGQMVKPFEDALFALAEGETSDIVETEFGYHIIRVDDVRGAPIESFESKRDELVAQVKRDAVDSMMYDLSEIMANASYENPDSLEPAAEALEQPIRSSELFTRNSGTGIAANEAVRKAAFSSNVLDGMNSDMIELSPDDILVLRVKQHIEAAPVPLDSVRSTITESIRIERGQELTAALAEDLIAELKAGASIASVLRDGITNKGDTTVSNRSVGEFEPYLISEILSMPLPEQSEPVYQATKLASGDVALIVLRDVRFPENIDEQQLQRTLAQYRQTRAVEDFAAMLGAYKDRAEIHINQKAIDRE